MLKARLGWKGSRGYSAYELALQNGFIGTEKDWLASLGTSSHFDCDKRVYETVDEDETELELPDSYTSFSFVDVYVNGIKLDNTMYSIENEKVVLTAPLEVIGTKTEVIVWTMATNELPIVGTINESSDETTVPNTKSVYDFVENEVSTAKSDLISNETINENKTFSNSHVTELLLAKFNKNNIAIVEGQIPSISPETTSTTDATYPSGFNKNNTVVLSAISKSNNTDYVIYDLTADISEFPSVTGVTLGADAIRVQMLNTNTSNIMPGDFKLILLRVED